MKGRLQLIAFVVVRAGRRVLMLLPEALVRRHRPDAPLTSSSSLAELTPAADIRLFIGPANSAGQGWQWARAVEREIPDVGAVAMAALPPGGGFHFAVDQTVPLATYRWSRSWSRAQRHAMKGFTHVLAESGRPLFGDAAASAFSELDGLRRAGVKIGLVFHGSDLRSPKAHAASSPWSPFREPWALSPTLERRVTENVELARRLGGPVFVTTPDLLGVVPESHWLPVVVDVAQWAATTPALERERLIVAHAPSSARVKGTSLIEPALRALENEGLIEYRRIQGVPADEMPAHYADVDVVLDQFRLGAYGVTAVEALAASRLVVGMVTPEVRRRVIDLTGRDLPIVNADPTTLAEVVRNIAADRAAYRKVAAEGPAFAHDVHGGAGSVRALRAFL